jgi:hypothetical protein
MVTGIECSGRWMVWVRCRGGSRTNVDHFVEIDLFRWSRSRRSGERSEQKAALQAVHFPVPQATLRETRIG